MNVLYVIRTAGHIRTHKSTLRAFCARGYAVTVLYDTHFSNPEQIEKARVLCDALSIPLIPAATSRGIRASLLRNTRDLLSYRRYIVNKDIAHLEPFRKDWKVHLPFPARMMLKIPFVPKLLATKWCARILMLCERFIPPNVAVVSDIQMRAPDVLVVSPVNMRESSVESEYLKAAHALGIPTALPVYSWDNLTVRGLFHTVPDRLLCWNEAQAEEARKHQNIPAERIRIVGAPVFDPWFEHVGPTTPRESFCKTYGLNPAYPIVTYLGSARNIVQDETRAVHALRAALDASRDEHVRNTQIVLRVHPGNYRAYVNFFLPGVVEVPKLGSLPDTDEALRLFRDTLAHSAAVIQINTSGAVDAIIAGTPCISLLYPEYASQQVDTIHFKQLMASGASDLPRTPEECVACVTRLLHGADTRVEARKQFIGMFIRPRGLSRAAGEWAADEIEKLVNERV